MGTRSPGQGGEEGERGERRAAGAAAAAGAGAVLSHCQIQIVRGESVYGLKNGRGGIETNDRSENHFGLSI